MNSFCLFVPYVYSFEKQIDNHPIASYCATVFNLFLQHTTETGNDSALLTIITKTL